MDIGDWRFDIRGADAFITQYPNFQYLISFFFARSLASIWSDFLM